MAYVGLAEAYILCVSYQVLPADEVVPKIKEAANRALELNPTLGEAQNALAAVTDKECRFADVLQDYDRAVRMSPNYATRSTCCTTRRPSASGTPRRYRVWATAQRPKRRLPKRTSWTRCPCQSTPFAA